MIIILGLGKTGLSCVEYFLQQGITPVVMDSRTNPPGLNELPEGVKFHAGLNAVLLCQAELIVASPGIALATPELAAAAEAGVEIVGDIELFARKAKKPIVAITGSNGKSTVTTLVGEMLSRAGLKVGVGGNIGTPALSLLGQAADVYVLELSSFQLETTHSLHPHVSVVLNLSEDHLDRYQGSMALYRAAKMRIHEYSKHILVNRDDSETYPESGCVWQSFGLDTAEYGRVTQGQELFLSRDGTPLLNVAELKIVGAHNHANALAALALCDALKSEFALDDRLLLQGLKEFGGLPHRAVLVREVNGVRWINDSKATNVGAMLAAVAGLKAEVRGRLVLLAGGQGKGQDFAPLQVLLGNTIAKIYCFGQDGALLAALGDEAELVSNLEEAVERAAHYVQAGDCVLLAPACASLDQFKSFEARGDRFAELVLAL